MRAVIDNNGIRVALGISNADGVTPVMLYVDATQHALVVEDNTTGSDLSGDIAKRDDNNQPTMMGVSNADGATPTAPYINPSTKELLIKST